MRLVSRATQASFVVKRLIFITVFSTSFSVNGQNSLSPTNSELLVLCKAFDDKVASELATMRASQFAPIEKRYLEVLKRGKSAAQQSGNLEEARLFEQEINQIDEFVSRPGTMITSAIPDAPPNLGKLRGIYLSEVGKFESAVFKRLEPMVNSQKRSLNDLATKLTRQGSLQEAGSTKTELDRIQLANCRVIGGSHGRFERNAKAYSNREYVWVDLPDALMGLDFNMTTGGVPQSYQVEVLRPGVLHVAAMIDQGEQAGKILINEGFKKTDHVFKHSPRGGSGLIVFSKYVVQGVRLPEPTGCFSGFVIIGNLK